PLFAEAGHPHSGTGHTGGARVDAGSTGPRRRAYPPRLYGRRHDQGIHLDNMKKSRLDPITLEIQWKGLVSMVDEASAAFVRTSFSVLVREANDFAGVLTDAEGRSIAQSVLSI